MSAESSPCGEGERWPCIAFSKQLEDCKGAVTRASFWHFSANTGVLFCQYWQQKVREASHDHRCFPTSIGIFAAFYHLWLLKTHFWHLKLLPILVFFSPICVHWLSELPPFIRLVSDQNNDCKDASIGGKDDDHWCFQFCYRYWQKNASIGRKRRQYW